MSKNFNQIMRVAVRYDKRFAHLEGRTHHEVLEALGYDRGVDLASMSSSDYDKFVNLCTSYIVDPDDEAVYLVK